jgi:transcriptional regulator of acetoin/glycerol metabolism
VVCVPRLGTLGELGTAPHSTRPDVLSDEQSDGLAFMIDLDREWLTAGVGRATVTRPEIVSSWRRCQVNGADPDRVAIVQGDASLDSRFPRLAIPVLDAMADVMVGAKTSLLLSGADGTMLWRWSEDTRLTALLNRNSAVVGTRWSEDIVGTNGLGTSLETIAPIVISGSEHFSEALHSFTCAGAAIRNPITRRVAGSLSVTSLTEDSSPLMEAALKKLVMEVEEQLYGDSTVRERELLHHFLAERHCGRNTILAINHDTMIASKAGARLHIDHSALWSQVETAARENERIEVEALDFVGEVSCRTIEHAGSVVGLVIVAEGPEGQRLADRATAQSPDTQRNRQLLWAELPARLREVTTGRDRLLVAGEAGVGKRTILREVLGTPDRPVHELDCAAVAEVGAERWLTTARELLSEAAADGGVPVVVSHLETLTAGQSRALGRILDQLPRGGEMVQIAGTWTPTGTEPDPLLQTLLDRFSAEPFDIPPLRKRRKDVMCRLVDQGTSLAVLTPDALEQVQRHPWPGNHRQLEEFRRWLGRQKRPTIGVDDLPPRWLGQAARARLTVIQAAEADAIEQVLRKTNGNKVAAAAALGISRSSLYRKMREYKLA